MGFAHLPGFGQSSKNYGTLGTPLLRGQEAGGRLVSGQLSLKLISVLAMIHLSRKRRLSKTFDDVQTRSLTMYQLQRKGWLGHPDLEFRANIFQDFFFHSKPFSPKKVLRKGRGVGHA